MKTNNEIKIAVVVGLIMILVCIVILMVQHNKVNEIVDLNVYKHFYVNDNKEAEGYYQECSITTEELSNINRELKKVKKLDDNSKTNGIINGDYKIILNDEFFAFDEKSNSIYRSSDESIHVFSSSMYETIINRCEG